MSQLQNVVNSLAKVILNYSEVQGVKVLALDQIIGYPHYQFIETLQAYINECSKKAYHERAPLLSYLLKEIDILKPLLEKGTILTEGEIELVKIHLKDLTINLDKLLHLSKNSCIEIGDNKKTKLYGFKRSLTEGYALCASGQSIKQNFMVLVGKNDFSEPTVTKTLEKLIKSHQHEIKIQCEEKKIRDENESLRKENQELLLAKQELEKLKKEHETLREESKVILETNKQLENNLQSKNKELERLSQELHQASQDKQILEKEKKIAQDQAKEIEALKKELKDSKRSEASISINVIRHLKGENPQQNSAEMKERGTNNTNFFNGNNYPSPIILGSEKNEPPKQTKEDSQQEPTFSVVNERPFPTPIILASKEKNSPLGQWPEKNQRPNGLYPFLTHLFQSGTSFFEEDKEEKKTDNPYEDFSIL